MNRIYLDNAASPKMTEDVKKEMDKIASSVFANPSSAHQEGREARSVIDIARTKIAKILEVQNQEIIFTSGATESNALALKGVAQFYLNRGVKPKFLIGATEHPSIIGIAEQLEKQGVKIEYIPVDKNGLVLPKEIAKLVDGQTKLISISLVNHEIGVVQNLKEIIQAAKEKNSDLIFHTDAAQGLGWLDININDWQIDMMTISAYKIYGPKGIGVLYKKNNLPLTSIMPGTQEWHWRGGTESPVLIAGMAQAFENLKNWDREGVRNLRNILAANILENTTGARLNTDLTQSVPHIIHFSFKNIDSQILSIALDKKGIATSPGSACASGAVTISHVVKALKVDTDEYSGQLRLSLSLFTSKDEIKKAAKIVAQTVSDLQK